MKGSQYLTTQELRQLQDLIYEELKTSWKNAEKFLLFVSDLILVSLSHSFEANIILPDQYEGDMQQLAFITELFFLNVFHPCICEHFTGEMFGLFSLSRSDWCTIEIHSTEQKSQ